MIVFFLQLALLNDVGQCAPNWVFVANPSAPECKTFSENFRDACAQCNHGILPAWCNPPPVKCPECLATTCESLEPRKNQVRLLQKQAKRYRARILELEKSKHGKPS